MTPYYIEPEAAAEALKKGQIKLIDIRDPDEYAREHIPGAICLPVSVLEETGLDLDPGVNVVFHCLSGARTDRACTALSKHVDGNVRILKGGLSAWRSAGLDTHKDASAALPINRQVQITAGLLVLLGVVLGWLFHPGFFGLSAFVGAGLTFAGLSGWCGMANLLMLMPWNRRAGAA